MNIFRFYKRYKELQTLNQEQAEIIRDLREEAAKYRGSIDSTVWLLNNRQKKIDLMYKHLNKVRGT